MNDGDSSTRSLLDASHVALELLRARATGGAEEVIAHRQRVAARTFLGVEPSYEIRVLLAALTQVSLVLVPDDVNPVQLFDEFEFSLITQASGPELE